MCGVRCTPNLAAYCNNGLNLTYKGIGVIFKLLHKLCFSFFRFLFQCLTHTEKALKDFLPVTQARHGAGRVIHTNLDYCQSLYISFIFAVLIIANLFSITANNPIYGTLAKSYKGRPIITRQHHTGNYLHRAPLCPVRESEG